MDNQKNTASWPVPMASGDHIQTNGHSVDSALSIHDLELYQFTLLSGISMDPDVFKIVLSFLKMGVPPHKIFNVLKSLLSGQSKQPSSSRSSSNRRTNSVSSKKPPVAAKPKK